MLNIIVEDETIPFGLYTLVRKSVKTTMNVVKYKPGQNLAERRLTFLAADLVGLLQQKKAKEFGNYYVYFGGHHIAIQREGSSDIKDRVILIEE